MRRWTLNIDTVVLLHSTQSIPAVALTVLLCAAPAGARPKAAPTGLDALLLERSQRAMVSGDLPRASALLKGAVEISPRVDLLQQLAQAQVMAGRFEDAIEQYESILKLKPPEAIVKDTRREIDRLRAAPAPFTDQLFQQTPARPEAQLAFARGSTLLRGKRVDEAIRFLRAALVLDPTLPGTYRLLGAAYGKLGDSARERAFLLDYLRVRPDGQIADLVRERLRPTGILGTLEVDASFPCDVWINGRSLQRTTPVKGLELPPGRVTVSFVSAPHHIIRNLPLQVTSKKVTRYGFRFGVLVTKLDPWARVRSSGRDLGLWDAVGLPAGDHNLELVANDGSRKKRIKVRIDPGQTVVISKW